MKEVVVTGLGGITPLGSNVPDTWNSLIAGTSGVRVLGDDFEALPVRFAATSAVDPADLMDRVEARKLDRSQQFALVAAREAWSDAGSPEVDPERLGVVVASGIGGILTVLSSHDTLKEKGPRRVSPHMVPMLMPNGPAAHVGLDLGARAGVHTPVSACASGAEAIGYAMEMIRTGRADVVVAGGTEAAIHPLPIAGFAAMMALSTRNDDPTRASRPYDRDRDGFVMGEGAAIVVLESAEHARSRNARIYARVAGQGITSDGYHIAAPDPDGTGAARAMRLALEDAGISPADVRHLNAHATSTPAGDVAEAGAVLRVFADAASSIAVSGTKSMTGHLLGGAGAIESVFAILALHHRLAPPTINIENLDPEVAIDVVRDQARPLPDGQIAALNNSFGFGGHNVALVITSA